MMQYKNHADGLSFGLKSLSVGAAVALFAVSSLPANATTRIQGTHAFIKALHTQVGVRPNGAFGSSDPDFAAVSADFNANAGTLGFLVSRNRNGFGTGKTDGDFFTPGTPYEGWGLSVGAETKQNTNSPSVGCPGALSSLVVGDATTRHSVTWTSTGACLGLNVSHVYSVADDGQSLRMVTTLTNNTGATIDAIIYGRGVDPDNAYGNATWDGNTFISTNTVISQGSSGNAAVKAEFASGALLALTSSDARAIVGTDGTFGSIVPKALVDGTAGWNKSVGARGAGDSQMGLAIDVGSLAAGASTTFTVEYNLSAAALAAAAPSAPAPTVTSVSPSSGPGEGGTVITITGTDLTGATGVTIGGNACRSVTVVSATTITCTTPSTLGAPAGQRSVVVTTAGGSNAANTLFTYTSAGEVPTLSEWALILFALMLGGVLLWYQRPAAGRPA